MSLRRLGLILLFLAAGGCKPGEKTTPAIPCYLQSRQSLADIRRTVLVEPAPGEFAPGVVKDLTASLARSIGSRGVFQVDAVDASSPGLEGIPLDGRSLSLEQMRQIRSATGADAVVQVSLTAFHPYPRMRMGLRARLVDLRSGQLVWSVDHVWDGTQEATAKRIQQYHKSRTHGTCEPLEWRVALVSPKAFGEFVAEDVARTLSPPGWAAR